MLEVLPSFFFFSCGRGQYSYEGDNGVLLLLWWKGEYQVRYIFPLKQTEGASECSKQKTLIAKG